jgi:hypothetical protein
VRPTCREATTNESLGCFGLGRRTPGSCIPDGLAVKGPNNVPLLGHPFRMGCRKRKHTRGSPAMAGSPLATICRRSATLRLVDVVTAGDRDKSRPVDGPAYSACSAGCSWVLACGVSADAFVRPARSRLKRSDFIDASFSRWSVVRTSSIS